MSEPLWLTNSPLGVLLLRWTALLALGWIAHGLLRNSHARWRLILWRGILCFGLVLPWLPWFPKPAFSIAVPVVHAPESGSVELPITRGMPRPMPSTSAPSTATPSKPAESQSHPDPQSSASLELASWAHLLSIIWLLGAVCGATRLIWFHVQLRRLRKTAAVAGSPPQRLAGELQAKLGVRRPIEIRVSDSIGSPFLCGPLKPLILLPESLARTLASDELSALLAHEIAHARRRDLLWCVGWRWLRAIWWLHPLVWNVPAAHSLACEEEADRLASAHLGDQAAYAQSLAQLTLRVLALSNVETAMAMNGTAQIVQRLNRLGRAGLGAWKWWSSAVAILALGLFFFLIYGTTDEPVYHFRSVTQWLDRMAMFDELRTLDKDDRHSYRIVYPPEVVTNDPALRALLALGPKAVPTLVKTLFEPPQPFRPEPEDPIQRIKSWTSELWQQVQAGGSGAPSSPPPYLYYGSFQQARMAAAGLAMLALGSNNNAGSLRLLVIEGAARSKGYRNPALDAFTVANAGLPERHNEIIAGIVAGLNDANPQVRFIACSATQGFHTNLPEWRWKLMELAQGPDTDITLPLGVETTVSQSALWSLACAGQKDSEIVDLCEKSLQDKTRPPRLRALAAAGLGMAGDEAKEALPLLRSVLTEQGIPKGSGLTGEAGKAIERIEKSVANRNPISNSTPPRN